MHPSSLKELQGVGAASFSCQPTRLMMVALGHSLLAKLLGSKDLLLQYFLLILLENP